MEKPLPTTIIETGMKSLQLFTSHTTLQNHTGLLHMFYVIKNNLQSKVNETKSNTCKYALTEKRK